MTSLPPMKKCSMDYYQGIAFLSKFDISNPSVTRDEEICGSHVITK